VLNYIVRRLLLALLTTWAISVLAFVIIQLPAR
jgi:ABC-type microcin C transport system permease subunit YejB